MLFTSSSPLAPPRSDLHLPIPLNLVPFFCFDNSLNPLCAAVYILGIYWNVPTYQDHILK